MRTKEEQQELEVLMVKLFGDKEGIEADPNDPEIKRFLHLRDLERIVSERTFTVEELMRDG